MKNKKNLIKQGIKKKNFHNYCYCNKINKKIINMSSNGSFPKNILNQVAKNFNHINYIQFFYTR